MPYSPYVSSAQELSDDLNLVDIGMQGLFGVYDDDGNLKAQYKMVLSSGYIYRVYQYGFRGFYFACGLASTSRPMPILQRPIPICYRFAASYLRRIRSS